jgi:hypothetical protein
MAVPAEGNMRHLIGPASPNLTDPLISDSIGHAIGWGAFELGMAETGRFFCMLRGDLK